MSRKTTKTSKKRIGFAITGSFCTFHRAKAAIAELVGKGYDVFPVMSFNAAGINTRFGAAAEHIAELRDITGNDVIRTIEDAEPIGPQSMFDLMVIAPCTGNTAAKLAIGITDTPVTMAVKSFIRGGNAAKVLVAMSTNDALSGAAKNIGLLSNMKPYYFVPAEMDDPVNKPFSLVADFSRIGAIADTLLG
ncbi:dipicolinate synthase subunit B [Clostridia bacterium]|nr:dipicolinate synthase subunit B [Clostridia bacterium]